MNTGRSIHLRGTTPEIDVDVDHVYFPFASGRLTYDCATCGSQCCRGHDYLASRGPELDDQVAATPALRFFVQPTGQTTGGTLLLRNYQPGCFFLSEGGLCGIQCGRGYAAKPETCRLFPFNSFTLVGPYLVAAPHFTLCPLGVAPDAPDARSDWGVLTEEMRLRGVAATMPRLGNLDRDPDEAIALERSIVSLSEQLRTTTGYPEFVSRQIEATLHSERQVGGARLGSARSEVTRFLAACRCVLGTEAAAPAAPDVDRLLIALTPVLRSRFLFRDAVDLAPPQRLTLDRLPFALLVIYLLATFARASGMRAVTYQTITKIVQSHAPLIHLLAHLDLPMAWREEADIPLAGVGPHAGPFIRVAKALLPSAQARNRQTLAEIICAAHDGEGLDRVAFLNLLAARLTGAIQPCTHLGRADWRIVSIRRGIQRWGLRWLDEHTLRMSADLALAGRAARAGAGGGRGWGLVRPN